MESTSPTELPNSKQLEEAKKVAQVHAERINELAGELAKEIRLLKACADQLSPMYWQVYYKPFITGFKTISVPLCPFRWGSVDNCQPYCLRNRDNFDKNINLSLSGKL